LNWIVPILVLLLILEGLRFWPRWSPDPPAAELAVGVNGGSLAPDHARAVTSVPNVRLGMSDLILCRDSTSADARSTWECEPTIQRTFRESQSFRLCAAVNLGDHPASAGVDLVDASGRVARHLDAPVVVGALTAIPRNGDDLIDAEPADHFGQIDVTVDLHGLRPGHYAVRLTLTAGAHTSVKAEPIVVAAAGDTAAPGHSA
jgi:hypothetical protein